MKVYKLISTITLSLCFFTSCSLDTVKEFFGLEDSSKQEEVRNYSNGSVMYKGFIASEVSSSNYGKFEGKGVSYSPNGKLLYNGKWKNGIPKKQPNQCSQYQLELEDALLSRIGSYINADSLTYTDNKLEKRIYLVDVTGSMEGKGNTETPNIFSEVKNNLVTTIQNIENVNTEVVIIPFTNKSFQEINGFISAKDSLVKEINNIKIKSGDTNIADAWNKGVQEIDSTKINYLFLLTDGLHNCGPDSTVLYDRLKDWYNISNGNYYFAFYVMLTTNAQDQKIRDIASETKQMEAISSMDVNASFINTAMSRTQNVNNQKTVKINFTSNNDNIFSEDINFDLQIEKSPYYQIKENSLEYHFKERYLNFEIEELKPKVNLPLEENIHLYIHYDKEKYPLVFFTPEVIDFKIVNQGIRAMAIANQKEIISAIDTKTTFREPFMWILKSRPNIFVKSLNYPPYKWFVPDTMTDAKRMYILANEECIRSKSEIELSFVNKDFKIIQGVDLYVNGSIIENGKYSFKTNELLNPFVVECKVPVSLGKFAINGQISMKVNNIDELNNKLIHNEESIFGQWTGVRDIAPNYALWTLWLLTILIIVAIIAYLIYLLIRFFQKGHPVGKTNKKYNTHGTESSIEEAIQLYPELGDIMNEFRDGINEDFPKNCKAYKNIDGSISIVNQSFPNTKITIKDECIYAEGGSNEGNGEMNQFLNYYMPNKTYIVDDCFKYKTDEYGRVKEAYADRTKGIKLPIKRGPRDSNTQKRVRQRGIDGVDDGGHIFANSTNGPNELINQVPMKSDIQRSGGEWRNWEIIEEKALKEGKKVTSKRSLLYKGNSKRPYAIKVETTIDGERKSQMIYN